MPAPKVSIILLSYNRKEEILDCMASLQKQTFQDYETIVLDNGSKDGSAEAVAEHYPEANLIRLEENSGAWKGRDIAIREAKGDYLFMIDSDAVAPPELLEELVRVMNEDGNLGIIQPMIKDLETDTIYNMGFGRENTDRPFYRWQFHGCAALIRKRAYEAAGGFPRHYLVAGGEAYLSVPLIDAGYRILYWPKVHVRHALSPKERIKSQRLLMSNLHRMQNNASFNPYLERVWLDFFWKTSRFGYLAAKNGHWGSIVSGTIAHFKEFFHTLRHYRRPIQPETQNIIDQLKSRQIFTGKEYERALAGRRPSLFSAQRWGLENSQSQA